MARSWTDDQKRAISWEKSDILVSAAAGSGKTAALVERVIQRLTDRERPCDADRMLIVTFTRAAAGEMRQKITARLLIELESHPDDVNLQRQSDLIHKAPIQTVHAFCSSMVKKYAHLLDVPPRFRIGDENELRLARNEIAEQVLEEYYDAPDNEDFLTFVDMFSGGRNDSAISALMLSLFDKLQSHPYPDRWLDRVKDSFEPDMQASLGGTRWGGIILAHTADTAQYAKRTLETALDLAEQDETLSRAYCPALSSDIALVSEVCRAAEKGDFDELYALVGSVGFERLKSSRGCGDKALAELVKSMRKEATEAVKDLSDRFFCMEPDGFMDDIAACAPAMRALCSMVSRFSELFSREKTRRGMLDFNDLEHRMLDLLIDGAGRPTDAAAEIRRMFDYVLVDEYQDTNEIQDMIFSAVSRGDNLFMVGDVKQSIYSFRQARPDIFMEKYLAYSKDEGAKGARKIVFSMNFRSRRQVIDCVNMVFDAIMSPQLGDTEYGEDEMLYTGAVDYQGREDENRAELLIIHDEKQREQAVEQEPEQGGSDGEEPDTVTAEAEAAACRVEELFAAGYEVFDRAEGRYRPLRMGDIAVLLRTVQNAGEIYERVFAAHGFEVRGETSKGFFSSTEIMVMTALMKCIDNPRQDIALIGTMCGPVFGFTPDELLKIRVEAADASYFDAVRSCAGRGDARCADFLDRLEVYRSLAEVKSIGELIWYLYEDTGLWAMAGAMKNGRQRQANLRWLFDLARRYEETGYRGLFSFINYLTRLTENEGDLPPASVISDGDDAIRIMSIHKSKGLEFPVVILGGLARQFNLKDLRAPLLVDAELGLGPQMRDVARSISYPTIAKEALAVRGLKRMLSEEERILYVAMTRASEKLIMLASCGKLETTAAAAQALTAGGLHRPFALGLMGRRRYLDWILAAVSWNDGDAMNRLLDGQSVSTGCLDIRCIPRGGTAVSEDAQEKVQRQAAPDDGYGSGDALTGELERRYSFEYPFRADCRIPAKISVTELKGRIPLSDEGDDEASARIVSKSPRPLEEPRFVAPQAGLTPAQRGTALHAALQYMDLSKVDSLEHIDAQLDFMEKRRMITTEQRQAVPAKKLFEFFDGPLGRRMLAARRVWREERFTLLVPSEEIGAAHSERKILLQGMIDGFFEERDGKVVLIDFKTDRIGAGGPEAICRRYAYQLELYRRAIKQVYGFDVEQSYLYLFENDKAYLIE